MKMDEREQDGVVILTLRGELDTQNLPALRDKLEELIGAGRRQICINTRSLDFINSAALGYLTSTCKRLREENGDIVLSEPSRFFRAAVRTLELYHIFQICETDDDAIASFRSQS